jgi:SpoVK/Ycf46/Vps4 family AAA+-type ATPase
MELLIFIVLAVIIGLVIGLLGNSSNKADQSYSTFSDAERIPMSVLEKEIKNQENDKPSSTDINKNVIDAKPDEQTLLRRTIEKSEELKSIIISEDYSFEAFVSQSGNVMISGRMFGEIRETIISMHNVLKDACEQKVFLDMLRLASHTNGNSNDYFFNLKSMFIKDIIRCYQEMGYNPEASAQTPHGQAFYIILRYWSDDLEQFSYPYNDFYFEMESDILRKNSIKNVNRQIRIYKDVSNSASTSLGLDDFNTVLSLALYKDEVTEYFRMLIFRLCQLLAKLDGIKTEKEKTWLKQILRMQELLEEQYTDDYGNPLPTQGKREWIAKAEEMLESIETKKENASNVFIKQTISSSLAELNELIGLTETKREIVSLSNYIQMKQKRDDMGLKSPNVSYHCVFSGNPGTGKTTVARILASIYKDLGILKSGHLIETDRSGLVAEYVGQTAIKTNKIIDEALDGVLFIDEAYSLVQGGKEDFGKEAIATLLKRMEDDRERLVVILAGYTNEIEDFINSNPGLRSRFNRYIHFEDYTAEELFDIFCLQVKKNEYSMSENTREHLKNYLNHIVNNKHKDFGNARFVRNLFERVIQNQANRLAKKENLTKGELTEIIKEDITII